jgi:ribose/xylose/arabinose/galactoside ABC-type transport system permease subunit
LPFAVPAATLSGDMQELGKLLATLGGVILLLGLALWSGFGTGWLGRLPGDIRIERGHSTFYFPIVTCILLSVLLSLLFSLFRR